MAEKVKSRAHLFYMPTPENDDHYPSIACTGMKNPREDKQLLPEAQRRQHGDQCGETITQYLRQLLKTTKSVALANCLFQTHLTDHMGSLKKLWHFRVAALEAYLKAKGGLQFLLINSSEKTVVTKIIV